MKHFGSVLLVLMCICVLLTSCVSANPILTHHREPASNTNHLYDHQDNKGNKYSVAVAAASSGSTSVKYNYNKRDRRQLDVNVEANYDEEINGAEISAEITGNLWRSQNGDARLDGTAKYEQRFNHYTGNGMPKIGASFHYRHD